MVLLLPLALWSSPLLSTNFATRGVLERERQAATKALCLGRIPKHKPQRIPNTIINAMIKELPPTATFHTFKKESKEKPQFLYNQVNTIFHVVHSWAVSLEKKLVPQCLKGSNKKSHNLAKLELNKRFLKQLYMYVAVNMPPLVSLSNDVREASAEIS